MAGAARPSRAPAPPALTESLLDIRDVVVRFGGVLALDRVSFNVRPGEIRGLIGPNGSGKTTLFNCISNIYRCQSGEIHLRGGRISGLPRHRMAALGIGRTFQNVALFGSMSVRDNVRLGAYRRPGSTREEALLDMLDLGRHAAMPAGALPFPVQKRVELARALMAEPVLLLLDEPAAGLNHEEVGLLQARIRTIRTAFATAILLVEHHMALVMAVSDRVAALEFGRKIADGSPADVQAHPEVIRAYLGQEA